MPGQTLRSYLASANIQSLTHVYVADAKGYDTADDYVSDANGVIRLFARFGLPLDQPVLRIENWKEENPDSDCLFQTRIFLMGHSNRSYLNSHGFVEIFAEAMRRHDYCHYGLVVVDDRNGNTLFGKQAGDMRDLHELATALSEMQARFADDDNASAYVTSEGDETGFGLLGLHIVLNDQAGPEHLPVDEEFARKLMKSR